MKRILMVLIILLVASFASATTVIYRISSGEVAEIWADNQINRMDPDIYGIVTDPPLPDGIEFLGPNYEHRVVGYTKIKDGDIVRNATQEEIDGFSVFVVDDTNQKEANKAIDYLNNDPRFRRILIALSAIIVDEINLLRAEHGLPERTLQQLRTAIENRISKDD